MKPVAAKEELPAIQESAGQTTTRELHFHYSEHSSAQTQKNGASEIHKRHILVNAALFVLHLLAIAASALTGHWNGPRSAPPTGG